MLHIILRICAARVYVRVRAHDSVTFGAPGKQKQRGAIQHRCKIHYHQAIG